MGIIGRMQNKTWFSGSCLALACSLALTMVLGLASCGRTLERESSTPTASATPASAPVPAFDLCDPYRHEPAMQPAAKVDLGSVDYAACYHIQLRVVMDPQPRLEVVQHTHYLNRLGKSLDALVFRLWSNVPGEEPNVRFGRVTAFGVEASHGLESQGTALVVALDHALQPDEAADVVLEYSVQVPVGQPRGYGTFNYQDGILLLSNVYAMVAVHDEDGWNMDVGPNYGDATYSEIGLFSVDVTIPVTATLVTSGQTIDQKDNGDGTVTWTCVSGPMRDFMIASSANLEKASATVGQIAVNSYYRPEHRETGEAVLGYARDAIRAYQQAFGVYPYYEFDVLEAPIPGGMEFPGLVLLGSDSYRQSGESLEFLVAHEVAHQWWYGLVGNDQVNKPWLDESLTNYSTFYYYDHVYGRDRAELAFRTYVAGPYEAALQRGRDAVVNQPVAAFDPQDYGPIVYGKGALFFYHVREQLGYDLMLEALRAYLQRNMYGVVTQDDLLAVLGGISGENLSELYEKWILG